MLEDSGATVLTAHFDGEKLVLDEPFDLPVGVPLKVHVPLPTLTPTREERLKALEGFIGMGKNLPRLDDKYIEDRDTYYEGRC